MLLIKRYQTSPSRVMSEPPLTCTGTLLCRNVLVTVSEAFNKHVSATKTLIHYSKKLICPSLNHSSYNAHSRWSTRWRWSSRQTEVFPPGQGVCLIYLEDENTVDPGWSDLGALNKHLRFRLWSFGDIHRYFGIDLKIVTSLTTLINVMTECSKENKNWMFGLEFSEPAEWTIWVRLCN